MAADEQWKMGPPSVHFFYSKVGVTIVYSSHTHIAVLLIYLMRNPTYNL